jgi:hypothetical protein
MSFLLKRLKTRLFKDKESQLLEQAFMTFDTILLKIKARHKETSESSHIIETIETLLQGEKNQRNANRIEQLIVPLLNDAEVSNELERKLFQVKNRFDNNIYNYYAAKAKAGNISEKQVLLTHIIKELQWNNEVQQVRINYAKAARIKTGLFFCTSFIFFLLPKFTEILLNVREGTRRYYILTALLSGWMGGAFSMLLGLKKHISHSPLEHLKITYRLDFIIVRVIIGMCAGLLFFYFFESGMLSGALLPDFSKSNLDEANFALLIIWCFLAGFSEKLVLDILSKSENLNTDGSKLGLKHSKKTTKEWEQD